MYITLETAKEHLRLVDDLDDTYISMLISVAEQAVSDQINEPLSKFEVVGDIPAPLKHAALLLIGQFYENREPVIAGVSISKIPLTLEYLLQPYKTVAV